MPDFKTVQFKSIVGKPVEIDSQINQLLRDGFTLKGKPALLPDGDLMAQMVKREVMPAAQAVKRFTPPVPVRGFDGRGGNR